MVAGAGPSAWYTAAIALTCFLTFVACPFLEISAEAIEGSIDYVAEAKGTVIGFWIRTSADSDLPMTGWLFAHPEHMRQGVARALRKEIWTEAVRRGADAL